MQAYSVAALTGGGAGEGVNYLLSKMLSDILRIYLGLEFYYYQTGSTGRHEEEKPLILFK